MTEIAYTKTVNVSELEWYMIQLFRRSMADQAYESIVFKLQGGYIVGVEQTRKEDHEILKRLQPNQKTGE